MPKLQWVWRLAALTLGLLLLIVCVPLVGAGIACRPFAPAPAVAPGAGAISAALRHSTADVADYARPEEQTYLTLPEWYIVYSADEYAAFIARNPPSHFPYFGAIRQYWRSYYAVCAVTRGQYPFNAGSHLMLAVIGSSFTLENIAKGLYENTLGRLTEWLSSRELTAEDVYARQVASEYGDFIHTTPWYEFPFGAKLQGLWRGTPFWGPNVLRKWERKCALSLEYGGKALYGRLIRQGTQATYAPEHFVIHAWVEGLTDALLQRQPDLRLVKRLQAPAAIVAMPRYQAFTVMVPQLVQHGVQFVEIAGNDKILSTVLAPREWAYDLPAGQFLFAMPILTQPALQRVAVNVPVRSLHVVLPSLADRQITLEHLYDY